MADLGFWKGRAIFHLSSIVPFFYVSEVGSGFEYFLAGFAKETVPKLIFLFQVELDELYLMVQSDFP